MTWPAFCCAMHSTSACGAAKCCRGASSSTVALRSTFALFSEAASRDEQTIEAFWASIGRFWGAWYRRQDFYQQINLLSAVMGY
ncbi:hypothetical protein [Enterobacter cloacae]|uniref:hypothetical protein n=1 Tax=Enterobacter cloacae TaxID=550 RepID=UPI0020D12F62|nr:hypothetical protein [Enterobacter cloacae]